MVIAEVRPDVEARAALVVERAEALHRVDSGGFEGDVISDQVTEIRALFHLFDVARADPPCHNYRV